MSIGPLLGEIWMPNTKRTPKGDPGQERVHWPLVKWRIPTLHPKTSNGIQPKCGKKDAILPKLPTHSRHSFLSTSWRSKNLKPSKQHQNEEECWWQLALLCPSASVFSVQLRQCTSECLGFIGGGNTLDSWSRIGGGGSNWLLEHQCQTQPIRQESPFYLSYSYIFYI